MRWKGRRQSTNVDDRRGGGGGRRRGGAGAAGAKLGGGAILVVIALSLLTGQDPLALLQSLEQGQGSAGPSAPGAGGAARTGGADDQLAEFSSVILADTEETWTPLFAKMGRRYQAPTLVLFNDMVSSACGRNSSAVGPFYCPGDHQLYLDLSFFRDLSQRHGAPGDFAQAYVIAHEVGHHVQKLLGISEEVHRAKRSVGKTEGNALSVLQELQADCFAGVWGHHAATARNLLERGDVEEGLAAAAAIGDDRLQKQSRGYVTPESFTHGSSKQRVEWFRRGLEHGTVEVCDTFADLRR